MNKNELEELAKKLEEKAKKRKKKPMRMHGASLRGIQKIQEKRILRQAQDKEKKE